MVDVKFDPGEVRALVKDLKTLEGGKQITAELRKGLKSAAMPIVRQTQGAASWSSRIPSAISAGTAFSAKRTGVFIKVNSKRAPHARAYENAGKGGTFRHPVFGKGWVSQPARPFFFKTAAGRMPDVEQAVGEVVDQAMSSAGFR